MSSRPHQLSAQTRANSSIPDHRRSVWKGSARERVAKLRSIHALLADSSQRVPRVSCVHARDVGLPVYLNCIITTTHLARPRSQIAYRLTIYLHGDPCRATSLPQLGLLPEFDWCPVQGHGDAPVTGTHETADHRSTLRPCMQKAGAMPAGFRLHPSRADLPGFPDTACSYGMPPADHRRPLHSGTTPQRGRRHLDCQVPWGEATRLLLDISSSGTGCVPPKAPISLPGQCPVPHLSTRMREMGVPVRRTPPSPAGRRPRVPLSRTPIRSGRPGPKWQTSPARR